MCPSEQYPALLGRHCFQDLRLHDGMHAFFFPSSWRWMSLKANPHIFLISGNKQKDTWTIML